MVKYVYYRDGLTPGYVVREKIEEDRLTAEAWDYKRKKWVPDAAAWETIDDQRNNWKLDEDLVDSYIQSIVERFPEYKDWEVKDGSKGAVRKRKG